MSDEFRNMILQMKWWKLLLVFLVLKLCHVIDWSWWWITLPSWGIVILDIINELFVKKYIKWRKNLKEKRNA